MASDITCITACPRLAKFLNPRLLHKGYPFGTVAHNDGARTIEDWAPIISIYDRLLP